MQKERKKLIGKKEKKSLLKICDKHRSKDGNFDVIVPSSGGKDSGFTAHTLKTEYGMHPLCITWAPFIYTDIGWKNFQNFVSSGFSELNFFPNGILHRKLARVAFELKGDAWEPFASDKRHMLFIWPLNLAFLLFLRRKWRSRIWRFNAKMPINLTSLSPIGKNYILRAPVWMLY